MTEEDTKKMAQGMTKFALDALVEIVTMDTNAPEARVAAAKEILNRGWGTAPKEPTITVSWRGGEIPMTEEEKQNAYAAFKREAAEETARRLAEIVRNPDSDPAHVVVAAKELLNRGWGPAPE